MVWLFKQFGFLGIPVLPSKSTLSDLGLIADLFFLNAHKLVLFLPEKSAFWPKKSKKSDFHCF